MAEPTLNCPNCGTEIKLNESLAAPLVQSVRTEYEAKIRAKEASFAQKEDQLRMKEKALEDTQKAMDEQIMAKLKAERILIAAQEAQKAKASLAMDLELKAKEVGELQALLEQRNEKLAQAQKLQADYLKKQRDLDDEKRELQLTIEQRVQASLMETREKAKKEAEEGLKLKLLEKEEQMASMQRQIEELRRKSEQGSQQLQGEVMELELQTTLQHTFPLDTFEAVAKGECGGDILHRVISPVGVPCGSILWETKRTKNWTDSWLPKLRGDQRAANANIAVLVSYTLPKEMTSFGLFDGVWVTSPKYAIPLVHALRQTLMEVANSRNSQEGQQTKMALVYDYLTGPRFRHRVEAIVEKFTDMQEDLDREKKAMTRLWAKREAQIQGVLESTVGMYGDLQGIAGRALQEIQGLEMPLLEG